VPLGNRGALVECGKDYWGGGEHLWGSAVGGLMVCRIKKKKKKKKKLVRALSWEAVGSTTQHCQRRGKKGGKLRAHGVGEGIKNEYTKNS